MRSIKTIIQFVLLLAFIIGGIYFGSENATPVRLVLVGKGLDPIPVWLVVLVAFFMGSVLAGIYFSCEVLRLWCEVGKLKKQLSESTHRNLRPWSPSGADPASGGPSDTVISLSSSALRKESRSPGNSDYSSD